MRKRKITLNKRYGKLAQKRKRRSKNISKDFIDGFFLGSMVGLFIWRIFDGEKKETTY